MEKLFKKIISIKCNADAQMLKVIGLRMHPETFRQLINEPEVKHYIDCSHVMQTPFAIVQKILGFEVESDPKIPKDNIRAVLDTSDWE